MDVNLPRDKETGKTKGFGFLMYEDARSCVLAVDNLNGSKILERTLRVDHVQNYRQPKEKGEDGEMVERGEPSMNAKPDLVGEGDSSESESEGSPLPEVDPEDPMHDYLIAKFKEEKAKKKKKTRKIRADESPEGRRARKARKKAKKEAREARKKLNGGSRSCPEKDRETEHRDRDDGRSTRRRNFSEERSRKRPRSQSPDHNNRRQRSRSPYSRSDLPNDDNQYRSRRWDK